MEADRPLRLRIDLNDDDRKAGKTGGPDIVPLTIHQHQVRRPPTRSDDLGRGSGLMRLIPGGQGRFRVS